MVVTQANHCTDGSICQMSKAKFPITNCKSNLYRFSSTLLTRERLNLYLLTKFPQGRLSDLLTSLHFPRSLDIPIIMSFLALSRVRARSCEFFCKKTKKTNRPVSNYQNSFLAPWLRKEKDKEMNQIVNSWISKPYLLLYTPQPWSQEWILIIEPGLLNVCVQLLTSLAGRIDALRRATTLPSVVFQCSL